MKTDNLSLFGDTPLASCGEPWHHNIVDECLKCLSFQGWDMFIAWWPRDFKSYDDIVRRLDHIRDTKRLGVADREELASIFSLAMRIKRLAEREQEINEAFVHLGSVKPERRIIQVSRLERDTEMVRLIKQIYDDQCQLCGKQLSSPDGTQHYSEGHHVKPLGDPHGGPDTPENILVVCPDHHVLLDNFWMPLTTVRLKSEQIQLVIVLCVFESVGVARERSLDLHLFEYCH